MDERVAKRDDLSLAAEPQLDLVPLVALLSDGEEVLAAGLDEPHGTAEQAGQERDQDVLGVDDRLGTEPAADVLRDDAHGVVGEREVPRHESAEDLGRLRRRPYRQLAELGVPAGQDSPRLHGHSGAAVQMEALAQDHVGPRERARGVAHALGEARGHVAAGMDPRPVGPERVFERGDDRQRLVLDPEGGERVLGLGGALGNDEGHRLPDVGDDVLRQDLGACRRGQARMWDLQRQAPECSHVAGHDDLHDPGPPPRRLRVDLDEAGVSVGGSEDRDVKHSGQHHVADVPTAPRHQPRVFAAADLGAEQALAHRSARRP